MDATQDSLSSTTPRRRRPVRRTLLLVVGSLLLLVVLAVGGLGTWIAVSFANARVDTVGEVDFDRVLAVPRLAESRVEPDGTRVFSLRMQEGESDLGGERPTPTWGFAGAYLGPTLRATRGEKVRVEVTNGLSEPSTVHWHGMHLPPEMDGGPHQMIKPGTTWSPHWVVDQPATTLWYHPHPHGATASHVRRGLAGMFLLDDPADSAGGRVGAALPHRYGVDDVPLVVQDVRLDDDGRIDDQGSLFSSVGALGDRVLVNGTPGPYDEVTAQRTRYRLLNASTARTYTFAFSDRREFALVGTDGGLVERPVSLDQIVLTPGERAEIVVTMEPGDRTVLRSEPLPDRFGGGSRFTGDDDRLDVLELRAADRLDPSPPLPRRLAPPPDVDPSDAVRTRTFQVSSNAINGRRMDMGRIDAQVEDGSTEIWDVSSGDGGLHNFHVHDVQFRVVSVGGRTPPVDERGWKDTVPVRPGDPVRLAVRFDLPPGASGAPGGAPYMFHCHLLRHEDSGAMGQFVVVPPGQGSDTATAPPTPTTTHAH
ncbi:multicopper oxidase domain-containing protein [Mumia sp.]|uniref:multicopper oxidase family protein n=1 Tax=Mumia sp. TaxID=1965300 RepID=UPI00261BEB95|nr:multicopper oxidase domain-containing protein [Mumia sp.]MDD9347199.1 multicopper oxidase domain-containing protein [Mumia sp.]